MSPSVREQLRREQREREATMSPNKRLGLALALGRKDLRRYAEAHGLPRHEARRALRRLAQRGRTPSAVMDEP